MPLQFVLDAEGAPYQAYVPGIEDVNDSSNVIISTNVSQLAIAAPAQPAQRAGWQIQNQGNGTMAVNELGQDASLATTEGAGSIVLNPRESIGTLPGCTFQVPLTQAAVSIIGTNVDDPYLARNW